MDKTLAKNILDLAEKELQRNGCSRMSTYKTVVDALKETEESPLSFFYMEGTNKMIFNSGRWRRRFLEDMKES